MEFSAQEIADIKHKALDMGVSIDLPSSKAGVKIRAEREKWDSRQVSGKGGRGGIKTVYTLPTYVIDELREKGLLHLIESGFEDMPQGGFVQSEDEIYEAGEAGDAPAVQNSASAMPYGLWAAKQERGSIVPVRYYKEVFASAGSGAIPWDTNPEAMWFRDSFFKYLGLNPADCFCTRIEGDSMHPTLTDLGTVLWQSVTQYNREGIYLFRQGEELRVKRLQRLNTNVFNIISDNPNKVIYPNTELDLSRTEPHYFEIIGRYLWHCGIAK